MNKYGKLTLGAVPIGDFKDSSLNLIDYIINHKIILVENVEVFNQLCENLNIKTNAQIINWGNTELSDSLESNSIKWYDKLDYFINILKNGTDILLLSDEGTAGIIDPGAFLLTKCKENSIPIKVMPGPNAIIPSIVIASFGPSFYFHGSAKNKDIRIKVFSNMCGFDFATIYFVTDDIIVDFIEDAIKYFGEERNVALCANLTKDNESLLFTNLKNLLRKKIENEINGDMTLTIQGKTPTIIN